jgi:cytochrome c biogenesis protein CcmG, thiol:disulfide interchange protein DsbE
MRLRPVLALIAAVAFVALLAFGLASGDGAEIAVGEPAPDAPVELLDGSGTAELADYRGEWVLLNFWASWCDPCRTESPAIEKWANRHEGEVTVVGMNTEDLTEDATDFVDEFGLTWDMLRDGDGARKDAFGIYALPESFLIDPEGNLALIRRGTVDEQFLEDEVTPLIEAGGPPAGTPGEGPPGEGTS